MLLFLGNKKSLNVSWSDDDESEGDEGKESVKHVAVLTSRISSDNESCDEDLAYDELIVSHKKLNDRNTDTCKQLEEQKNITNQLKEERMGYLSKFLSSIMR